MQIAVNLVISNNWKTIRSSEIKTILKMIFTGDLLVVCIKSVNKNVNLIEIMIDKNAFPNYSSRR